MPVIDRRANLTPNNARNADVASDLLVKIMPIQQQRIEAAFRVQGIQAILYNRLTSGKPCTCTSSHTQLSKLNGEGKANPGVINEILTGAGFGIGEYDPVPPQAQGLIQDRETSPTNTFDQYLGLQPRDGDGTNSMEDTAWEVLETPELAFDSFATGITDISCPICFGTSYVGGYTAHKTWRQVAVPSQMETTTFLNPLTWKLAPGTHTFTIILPKGAIGVDAFRAWNGTQLINTQVFIDNNVITPYQSLNYCDGLAHQVKLITQQELTHFEMQFALDKESTYFEIPKLQKSADLQFLETVEPFQIQISPGIASLNPLDVITESQFGKTLVVQGANPWNTRNRSLLAWEAQVRVIQPQELFRLLPKRKPIEFQQPTLPVVKTAAPGPTSFNF